MAAALLSRSNVEQHLQAGRLVSNFHRLFDATEEERPPPPKEKAKKKKSKLKSSKAEKSPERSRPQIPLVEIQGNPSSFTVYSNVRQIVLEQQIKQVSELLISASQNGTKNAPSDESDSEDAEKASDPVLQVPKVVAMGLSSVFELIRETQEKHPTLCIRALKALLDMLQGQSPEGLKAEPAQVIDSLFYLLMELAADHHAVPSGGLSESESLSSLACACLLSLVIARGDTGKLLSAVASLLMSPSSLATQQLHVPTILVRLQQSAQAVLLGRTQLPEWLSEGVKASALALTVPIGHLTDGSGGGSSSRGLACDGRFLYIHTADGLLKVGTGYGATIQGHLYCMNKTFYPREHGWLAHAQGLLFYQPENDSSGELLVINSETLQHYDTYTLEGKGFGPNVMFCDGQNLGHVASSGDDSFIVRTFSPLANPMPLVSELPLKLTCKCMDVFGSASFDSQVDIHRINTGFDEDCVSMSAGRDFALLRTSSGKILYTGKSQSLGIKQGGPAVGKWEELPIVKSPKIVHYSVGHESQHALLVAEGGAAFFVGTPRRGEDGDGSLSKARRQCKAVRPKRLGKLEGRHVVHTACNSGTSAAVTADGQLYLFGKDTAHCDLGSGLVTDLKEVHVVAVSLGKAHAAVLTNKGHVYTFGINNKGQCGRDFVASGSGSSSSSASREVNLPVNMAEEEEVSEESSMCLPGKHKWHHEECMVCTNCGECTGYGNLCIRMGQPNRNPGRPCGCGSGESGCSECGICRACAGETNGPDSDFPELDPGHSVQPFPLLDISKNSGIVPDVFGAAKRDLASKYVRRIHNIAGRRRMQNRPRAVGGARAQAAANHVAFAFNEGASASDLEQDRVKAASLPPARVEIGRGQKLVSQISCGLQHTVLLTQNGEVYTFGSNQYGQLGLGDTNVRGVPCRVHIKSHIAQVAAGGNHTVLLSSSGQVLTFGNHQKGQLGRIPPDEDRLKEKKGYWFALPGPVPGIGAKHGRKATWIGASGDQTFLRIDECLINALSLSRSNVVANSSCIGLLPASDLRSFSFRCLMISRRDGCCRSFVDPDQASFLGCSVCLDPLYDVLWSYSTKDSMIRCYNAMASDIRRLTCVHPSFFDILSPEIAIPVSQNAITLRSHAAFHLLGCLDCLTTSNQLGFVVVEEKTERPAVYGKEDFSAVSRFDSYGCGWGYSGHTVEAIRFMVDADILLGGFGLFGGRGEYYARIKVFELGPDGGENESDGECLAETDDQPYECGSKEKYPMMFDEPVFIQAHVWYLAWACIQGPSSDCGAGGHSSVTTKDQVVFKFKNSRSSNNGTDVNGGQIPQLLYRLVRMKNTPVNRLSESAEHACVLSKEFSSAVSPDCFEALLLLLNWSWTTFSTMAEDTGVIHGSNMAALHLDLNRLVCICTASLRLIRTYICEVYPDTGPARRTVPESTRLVECIGEARSLLKRILSENHKHHSGISVKGSRRHAAEGCFFEGLANQILDECHQTFTSCFHSFYPTAALKWTCLCELLSWVDPTHNNVEGWGRLLAAVIEALCHPLVKLTALLSVTSEHAYATIPIPGSDETTPTSPLGPPHPYDSQHPLLVGHMLHLTEMEGARVGACGQWSFREVLERMLSIVVLPVRQALSKEKPTLPAPLVANTCSLLAAVVGELSASASGTETDPSGSSRPMLTTPNRFGRSSPTAFWNTGNGSPDAVCFSVDRPGIVVAGVCLYGGVGRYEYELELLDDLSENTSDASSHTGRWNTLEIVRGKYSHEECVNDVAEIKFDKPFLIKENVKYAIKLRNRGENTLNGDEGKAKVKCPDGTTFTFSSCSLSSNGTNQVRGQIPSILYYSSQEGENSSLNSKALAEYQSRKQAITIASSIFRAAVDVLQRAQGSTDVSVIEALGTSSLFSILLPMVCAYIGPVSSIEPRGAVQILNLVQEILPLISTLNMVFTPKTSLPSPTTFLNNAQSGSDAAMMGGLNIPDGNTTSQHYAIIESEHPYKPATVTNQKVSFPETVRWMVLEFDPQCGTAQNEDSLQLYIPASYSRNVHPRLPCKAMGQMISQKAPEDCHRRVEQGWWPVLRRFSGVTGWPHLAVVLPGNKVCFSLETASDYVKDFKSCFYGFKCVVVGYEWNGLPSEGLKQLEKEMAYLGGLCASSLMRPDIMLPPAFVDEVEEDLEQVEEVAQQVFQVHSGLLSKGFALSQTPTVHQALDGNLPFSWSSNERTFLKDFVQCVPGTSGGRLAAWLQPESYLDPAKCEILYNKEDLKCYCPSVITVQTKDQYGKVVHVPNLKVEVKAVPVIKDSSTDERRPKRLSRYDEGCSLTFGGHAPPKLEVPYEVTVRDKKDAYHAICMMKAYSNYSFEELRFAAPAVRKPIENMLVRTNNDGTYSASWTPDCTGLYSLQVTLDSCPTGEDFKVEVREAPQGVAPPHEGHRVTKPSSDHASKMRKFVGQWSAGLRIRCHPSLQSEMLGVIPPNGVISFVDEFQNDDGVWLRLSPESLKEFCTLTSLASNGLTEAWALQYNQHLGKTLLVPVEQPKSIVGEIIRETLRKRVPELIRESAKQKSWGPGGYYVIKCGSSGHNIRCQPSLEAAPIGMVILGNQLTAVEELTNAEGTWVRLDEASVSQYCHNVEGEAWSLARSQDDVAYLLHEDDLSLGPFNGAAFGAAAASSKGFDFSSARQKPNFPDFNSPLEGPPPVWPSFFKVDDKEDAKGPSSSDSHKAQKTSSPSPASTGAWPPTEPNKSEGAARGTSPLWGGASGAESAAGAAAGPISAEEPKGHVIPPELRGVSVKELAKELNKLQLEREITRAIHAQYPAPKSTGKTPPRVRKIHLESELKGVSEKECVRLLGESWVNGNGLTPPRTPPGTPKKVPSRSSSPRAVPGGSALPRSASPLAASPSGPPVQRSSSTTTPPKTPVHTPPLPRRHSAGVTLKTPPTTRRNVTITKPQQTSSPHSSPRSSSCSPQRSASPLMLAERASSSSPVRPKSPASPASLRSAKSGDSSSSACAGHFSIGTSSPKNDIRMSPKPSRQERSRNLRCKRDRAASPAPREKAPAARPVPAEPVREALAPSVAQSLRAVFAAFLWHEGIVHDAMACASYLKFHPNLVKEGPKATKEAPSGSSREGSQAGSSQATPTGSLKKQQQHKLALNMNEAVRKLEMMKLPKERHNSESKASDTSKSPNSLSLESQKFASLEGSSLPLTMKHLVYFWDELSGVMLKVIQQNLILPSPVYNAKGGVKAEKSSKEKKVDKKFKKSKKDKYGAGAGAPGRGNLFGEAAEFFSGEKKTLCELCGGTFSHPVTYHMKEAHPGCGRHAGGQGYNSVGNFCGEWAGNCGDGGVGGSTWYLMCNRCRSKYLQEKRQETSTKEKAKKKAAPLAGEPRPPVLEPHLVMKSNAMFLLDLASSSAGLGLQQKGVDGMLPSVREDHSSSPKGDTQEHAFPPTQFLYLRHHGAEGADSAFADDSVFCDPGKPRGLSQSGEPFEPSAGTGDPRVTRSTSTAPDANLEPPKAGKGGRSLSAQVSPCDAEATPSERHPFFQRSISEIASNSKSQVTPEEEGAPAMSLEEQQPGNRHSTGAMMRRRNNSGGLHEGGMSLLKHPSVAMTRLMESVERGSLHRPSGNGLGDRTLQRPVISFVMQRHDLESLQIAMRHSLRKAACRVYALQAFNWLLRNVTMPTCIHDLLWHFVTSLSTCGGSGEDESKKQKEEKKELDQDKETAVCEHPLWDIRLAGEAVQPLLRTFHTFLQTVSDVMMYLPPGSTLQQMAVRCWCLKFKSYDHMFLHKSHVFSNISKILSKSDEGWGGTAGSADCIPVTTRVEALEDLTQAVQLKASSRQAMIASLTDNSTETFWESGDEDRNKDKSLTVVCAATHSPAEVYVHVDNSRDLGNKVTSIIFHTGTSNESMKKIKQCDLNLRHTGWVQCSLFDPAAKVIHLELKGPDNTLRLRQIKVLGTIDGTPSTPGGPGGANYLAMQQKNCEAETLKVFRLLTSQVFGRLISEDASSLDEADGQKEAANLADPESGDVDLKEHMVGILFSRSKLSHLQKQVCVHIVQAIRKETIRVQEDWEDKLQSGNQLATLQEESNRGSDAYCFELLSMVLALSGSSVGRQYLAKQHNLLQDLLSLLHTASPRVQRQVTALFRRVLPEVRPQSLASVLGITSLPPQDFSVLISSSASENASHDPSKLGILDVFLACIAKALTVQTKIKGQGSKTTNSYHLSDCIPPGSALGQKWWLRGSVSTQLAESIIQLLKDLASGSLSKDWVAVTKSAIAEAILSLTKLDESLRLPSECVRTPTMWLALASLCVLDQEHVERLSSGQWAQASENAHPRPTCDNHDDGETPAIIRCQVCGNLCADCDRFLHLSRKTRSHQRQIFKEEEEAIKVDLHEACGRTKLYWLMALSDSRTLKAIVEFRDATRAKISGPAMAGGGVCRFCGSSSSVRLTALGMVCAQGECLEHAAQACTRTLPCGHACGGICNEDPCLPCLHGCHPSPEEGAPPLPLKQDADDMCMICFTEALSAAPAIQLTCGHVFHLRCCQTVLQKRWVGPRITFGFSLCPICKSSIEHSVLRDLLAPIRALYEDVRRKALMRLEYEGLLQAEAITTVGARFHGNPSGFALDRYAYYVCYKCSKAYYGGEVRCEEQAGGADHYDPAELICGACSDVSRAQMCPKHGTDFLEYKCRYCCSVAVFFCFGSTHFCNACHDDFQRVSNLPKSELPHCPAGPRGKQLEGSECPLHVQHPPTGEEFALGCGVCRNAHTF